MQVDYIVDGPALLGTGGAVRRALDHLGPDFLVTYCDSWLDASYAPVVEAFRASGLPALMCVFRNENRWDRSNVEFENGVILAYDKKQRTPRMKFIDYGLGAFTAEAFDRVPADSAFALAELYGKILAERELAGFEMTHRFYEIGSPAGLEYRGPISSATTCSPRR